MLARLTSRKFPADELFGLVLEVGFRRAVERETTRWRYGAIAGRMIDLDSDRC
jgi:hypothetical protein